MPPAKWRPFCSGLDVLTEDWKMSMFYPADRAMGGGGWGVGGGWGWVGVGGCGGVCGVGGVGGVFRRNVGAISIIHCRRFWM